MTGTALGLDDPNVLDVTAVLTSATLNAVAEAFAAPAAPSPVVVVALADLPPEQAAWAAAVDPGSATVGPGTATVDPVSPAVDPAGGPGDSQASRSLVALDGLAAMTRAELAEWAADPANVGSVLGQPPTASAVAGWWAAADANARLRLIAEAPQLVGNLEGVPYAVRDAANREVLTAESTSLSARVAGGAEGRAVLEQLKARLHMVQQVEAALQTGDSGLPRTLIGFSAEDGGRAVIAVGDLETADYVSVLVPGMFYSVDSEIGSWAGAADQLAVDQAAWLERLTPAQHAGAAATVATVAWIGYQTPTVVNIASLDLAEDGSAALTASLRGLEATRGDRPAPYLSVLAHSYGATAALLALERDDISIDALAMVGSPGSPAASVGSLHVRDGNVWVADAALDPVSSTGVFGSQPLSSEYGAHRFGVGGAVDPFTGRVLDGSVGHVDYFTAGSESFRNMALIGIGAGAYVLGPDGSSAAAPRAQGR
ncbi:MAG: hypothetical protein KF727_00700 [Microbacteriaceae bacterium]|nr:hypothetical protein [Microbacteriaceae bacterium]